MKRLILSVCFALSFMGVSAQADSLLYEILFSLDSYRLEKSQKMRIDSALYYYPPASLKAIYIYGHTDTSASIEYNRRLSKNRVLSSLEYLVSKGVDPIIVKTDFYGEERPKYTSKVEEFYRNRRVEIVLEIDPLLLPQREVPIYNLDLKAKDKLRIPGLIFVGNQPIPIASSIPGLKDALLLMLRNPDLKLRVDGHVCCSNDLVLSEERADMVYYFLINNGIDKSRLETKGFGNKKPLFPEKTPRERELNRRVELTVISNSDKRVDTTLNDYSVIIRTQLLDISFFPKKTKLTPSGDFMLDLLSNSMIESAGLFYELTVINTISDTRLSAQRAKGVERVLLGFGVSKDKFSVGKKENTMGLPTSDNKNYILIKITEND